MAIELNEKQKEAIEKGGVFSRTTLKEEYRLKPTSNAEPVKYYKSDYGSKFPVFDIKDCVPMRPLVEKPRTEKQIKAAKKLAYQSQLKSRIGRLSEKIRPIVLDSNCCILDTETTGLESHDQVIEIAITDINGTVLFNQRCKPTVGISEGAFSVHGINLCDLQDCPLFIDLWPEIKSIILGKPVVIFNSAYDFKIIKNSLKVQSNGNDAAIALIESDLTNLEETLHCAMGMASNAFPDDVNKYGNISLLNACHCADVDVSKYKAHSALDDVLMTCEVLKFIANHNERLKEGYDDYL